METGIKSKSEVGAKPKRKLFRSPNYPAFGLEEALKRAQIIYQYEKRVPTTPGVILKHLGYKEERSGLGGRALSALRQYGLLEDKSGNYRISDLAFTLLHFPPGSQERETALREAAQKPNLFREILVNYKDGLPSDATLRSYLISQKGFNPASVDGFIRIFRQTISLANLTPGVYSEGDERTPGEGSDMPEAEEQARTEMRGMPAAPTAPDVRVFSWPLSVVRNVRAELRLIGRDFRPEDVDRLKKHFDLLREVFQEVQDGDKGQNHG